MPHTVLFARGVFWSQVGHSVASKLKFIPTKIIHRAPLFLLSLWSRLEFLIKNALLHIVQNNCQGFSSLLILYYNSLKHHTFVKTNEWTSKQKTTDSIPTGLSMDKQQSKIEI